MNITSFLSVKDFFNYYMAGFLWLLNVILILMPFNTYEDALAWLEKLQHVADALGILTAGLIVLIPYLVGFTLTPLSEGITKLLRKAFDDPKEWIIDYSEETKAKTFRHKGKRLAQSKIRVITKRLDDILETDKPIDTKNLKNWFFTIRAYVINSQGEAASFAIRAQDLVNFTESILLPFPMLFIVVAIKLQGAAPNWDWMFILASALAFSALSYRYYKLRFYWVKHIYNSFLAITGNRSK